MYCLFLNELFQTRVDRKGEEESSNVKDAYVMIKHSAFQLSLCCSYLLPTPHTQSHNWWSDRPALWNVLLCKQLVAACCWSKEQATAKWWGSIGLVGVDLFQCFNEKWALNWINPMLTFQRLIMTQSESTLLSYLVSQQNGNSKCFISFQRCNEISVFLWVGKKPALLLFRSRNFSESMNSLALNT